MCKFECIPDVGEHTGKSAFTICLSTGFDLIGTSQFLSSVPVYLTLCPHIAERPNCYHWGNNRNKMSSHPEDRSTNVEERENDVY